FTILIQYINSITKFIYDQWHTHE
ncbi:transposase, partial [Escherichia coli]|nr:transposase [Escherichia coli]EFO1666195.1 transposase [Escherichia coli]EGE0941792.1 transposase [Escherichia coli]